MKTWDELISSYYSENISKEYALFKRKPATSKEFGVLETYFEGDIPNEVLSLYSNCNGFGWRIGLRVYWFLIPIRYLKEMKDGLDEDLLPMNFYPIVKWANGDYSGYLRRETGFDGI